MHVKRDGFPVDALDPLSLQIHRDLQARVHIHPLPELVDHGGSEYHCREAEEYTGTFESRSETRCNDDANPPPAASRPAAEAGPSPKPKLAPANRTVARRYDSRFGMNSDVARSRFMESLNPAVLLSPIAPSMAVPALTPVAAQGRCPPPAAACGRSLIQAARSSPDRRPARTLANIIRKSTPLTTRSPAHWCVPDRHASVRGRSTNRERRVLAARARGG